MASKRNDMKSSYENGDDNSEFSFASSEGGGTSLPSTATGCSESTSHRNPSKSVCRDVKQPSSSSTRTHKRPLSYNAKSNITTTTETLPPVSAFDAVLQESQDLFKAAAEAQQLGRLKMSAAYLLLLHTRLVGLGKRFDKAIAAAEQREIMEQADAHRLHMARQKRVAVSQRLASLLPHNIELDNVMMEHLARAAAELHAARTGMQQHTSSSLVTSPTAREFLVGTTTNQQSGTNVVSGMAKAVAAIEQQEAQYWDGNNENSKKRTATTFCEGGVGGGVRVNNGTTIRQNAVQLLPIRNNTATTAMRTVPHANCNVRSLLLGAPFQEESCKDNFQKSSDPNDTNES